MGNYTFFRMHRITDIYFVGGFGTVQWIDVGEYLTATPDAIATNSPACTLQVCPVAGLPRGVCWGGVGRADGSYLHLPLGAAGPCYLLVMPGGCTTLHALHAC